ELSYFPDSAGHWPGPKLPAYPHVVESNADLLAEVLAEERDLGVPLAEVIEHDELCIHLHPSLDGLGGRAAKGTHPGHSQAGRSCCSVPRVTPHQVTSWAQAPLPQATA
uniref:Uncharacterized protein n=1 Tax=Ficedula albicollis TaxID=59894 RepID=A0A803VQG0_FICAL